VSLSEIKGHDKTDMYERDTSIAVCSERPTCRLCAA